MGLSGRDYMQPERRRPGLRGWWVFLGAGDKIIALNVIVFLLWHLVPGDSFMEDNFLVSWSAVFEHGRVWTLVTSAFSQQDPWHLLWNMVYLHWFALELEQIYGRRNFVLLYLYSAVVSALAHCAWAHGWGQDVPALGASGSVMAVVIVAAILYPTRTINIYLLPLPLWFLATFKLLGDFTGMVNGGGNVAHAAHLGGAAAGAAFWWLDLRLFPSPGQQEVLEEPGLRLGARLAQLFVRKKKPEGRIIPFGLVDAETARVDDILRKINREGMSSLTPEELDFLKAASARRARD